jgi:hypothetical protein
MHPFISPFVLFWLAYGLQINQQVMNKDGMSTFCFHLINICPLSRINNYCTVFLSSMGLVRQFERKLIKPAGIDLEGLLHIYFHKILSIVRL